MRFSKVIHFSGRLIRAFILEGKETANMAKTFAREGSGRLFPVIQQKRPTEEELKAALEQVKDIPRFLPFFVVLVAPVPGITEGYLLVATTLERWLGQKFRLLPSHFSNLMRATKPKEPKDNVPPDPTPANSTPPPTPEM